MISKVYDSKRIGLILPTYDGQSYNRIAVVNFALQFPESKSVEIASSALGHCFNTGYQTLLKLVDKGELDYIMMLHADIVPVQASWGEILIQEMLTTKASVLSVVSPIKSHAGLSSTGVMKKDEADSNMWNPIRFTMKEVYKLPETFTHPRLIVNTGCMIIDARQQWAKDLVFDLRCFVHKETGQSWYVPEDWMMSKVCWQAGGTVWATRKVLLEHRGVMGFPNTQPWGTMETEGALEVYNNEGAN